MVWHDQHGKTGRAQMAIKLRGQHIHLTLKTWANIVDRANQSPRGSAGLCCLAKHCLAPEGRTVRPASRPQGYGWFHRLPLTDSAEFG
jgi:hypothetical protein